MSQHLIYLSTNVNIMLCTYPHPHMYTRTHVRKRTHHVH